MANRFAKSTSFTAVAAAAAFSAGYWAGAIVSDELTGQANKKKFGIHVTKKAAHVLGITSDGIGSYDDGLYDIDSLTGKYAGGAWSINVAGSVLHDFRSAKKISIGDVLPHVATHVTILTCSEAFEAGLLAHAPKDDEAIVIVSKGDLVEEFAKLLGTPQNKMAADNAKFYFDTFVGQSTAVPPASMPTSADKRPAMAAS